jgi:hypothetical protein
VPAAADEELGDDDGAAGCAAGFVVQAASAAQATRRRWRWRMVEASVLVIRGRARFLPPESTDFLGDDACRAFVIHLGDC